MLFWDSCLIDFNYWGYFIKLVKMLIKVYCIISKNKLPQEIAFSASFQFLPVQLLFSQYKFVVSHFQNFGTFSRIHLSVCQRIGFFLVKRKFHPLTFEHILLCLIILLLAFLTLLNSLFLYYRFHHILKWLIFLFLQILECRLWFFFLHYRVVCVSLLCCSL